MLVNISSIYHPPFLVFPEKRLRYELLKEATLAVME